MNPANDTSVTLPTTTTRYRHHVNWHEAVACAVEIELRDYADLLQFLYDALSTYIGEDFSPIIEMCDRVEGL